MIAPTGDKYYFAALLFHGDACYNIDFTPTEGSRDELNTSNTIKVTAGHWCYLAAVWLSCCNDLVKSEKCHCQQREDMNAEAGGVGVTLARSFLARCGLLVLLVLVLLVVAPGQRK